MFLDRFDILVLKINQKIYYFNTFQVKNIIKSKCSKS